MSGSPCLQALRRSEDEARVELNRPRPDQAALAVEDCRFWMVWTKTGRAPTRTHALQGSAEDEADRLARKFPGKKFIVLFGFRKCSVAKPAVSGGHHA